METDWRGRVILDKLREGCIYCEAAAAAGMTKQGVLWRMAAHPDFAQAVAEAREAREAGAEERRYRAWLRHPFRGKRGPWWRPGVVPAFRYPTRRSHSQRALRYDWSEQTKMPPARQEDAIAAEVPPVA